MFRPYELKNTLRTEFPLEFYIINKNNLVVACFDEEYLEYWPIYKIQEKELLTFNGEINEIRPATRKELKSLGLWNLVVNKEDFSSEEDELEEYLRIGEEIEKEK